MCCKKVNPVSPMDDGSSGCMSSVISGIAGLINIGGLTRLRCVPRGGIDCHTSKGRLRTLIFILQNLEN